MRGFYRVGRYGSKVIDNGEWERDLVGDSGGIGDGGGERAWLYDFRRDVAASGQFSCAAAAAGCVKKVQSDHRKVPGDFTASFGKK